MEYFYEMLHIAILDVLLGSEYALNSHTYDTRDVCSGKVYYNKDLK